MKVPRCCTKEYFGGEEGGDAKGAAAFSQVDPSETGAGKRKSVIYLFRKGDARGRSLSFRRHRDRARKGRGLPPGALYLCRFLFSARACDK